MSHPRCDNRYCDGGCSLCAALERIDVLEPGAQNYTSVRLRAEKAEAFLEREGYRSCDIAACCCGSWHRHSNPRVEKLQAALEFQAAAAHAAVRALSRISADVHSTTEKFWKNFEANMCGENMQEADGKGHPCTLMRDHVGPCQGVCVGMVGMNGRWARRQ